MTVLLRKRKVLISLELPVNVINSKPHQLQTEVLVDIMLVLFIFESINE